MNINWVLDRNFSLLIGSDDRCATWNKMANSRSSALFYDYYNIHVSDLISTIYNS